MSRQYIMFSNTTISSCPQSHKERKNADYATCVEILQTNSALESIINRFLENVTFLHVSIAHALARLCACASHSLVRVCTKTDLNNTARVTSSEHSRLVISRWQFFFSQHDRFIIGASRYSSPRMHKTRRQAHKMLCKVKRRIARIKPNWSKKVTEIQC